MRSKLQYISEELHMAIHLAFGVLAFLVIGLTTGWSFNVATGLGIAILGSVLPDIDHFIFFFWYGATTTYAKGAKKSYAKEGLRGFVDYCKKNHKHNTRLVSHNFWVAAGLLPVLAWFSITNHVLLAIFAMAWIFHFGFDMLEDILFFGRVNENWKLN